MDVGGEGGGAVMAVGSVCLVARAGFLSIDQDFDVLV
jgi:hypothetical protein